MLSDGPAGIRCPVIAARIEDIAYKQRARVIARVPFDWSVFDALVNGKSIAFNHRSLAAESLRDVWSEVRTALSRGKNNSCESYFASAAYRSSVE